MKIENTPMTTKMMNYRMIGQINLPWPSPVVQALVAPFPDEATPFPRPKTGRTMVANSWSRLNPGD